MIYADANSTTACFPEVVDLVSTLLLTDYGNPSSRHTLLGRKARAHLDTARERLASAINAKEDEIIFTSGATEACNLALIGVAERLLATRPRIIVATTEHDAVLKPLDYIANAGAGAEVIKLPVDQNGLIDPDHLTHHLNANLNDTPTALVCIMLANNETGVLHDIPPLAELAHKHGALFFCDTTQALGKIPLDLPSLGCDFAVFSAHKCHGPKGVGALWKRRGLSIHPQLRGGGQETGLRSGTENMPGIAGFGLAVHLLETAPSRLEERSHALESKLLDALPNLQINGAGTNRLPGTTNLTLPGLKKGWLAQLRDVAASAGSSCASAQGEASHVLRAMGVSEKDAENSIRISFSRFNQADEIDHIAKRLIEGARKLMN